MGSEEGVLRRLEALLEEKDCSPGFLERVRGLLLELALSSPSPDPQLSPALLRLEELSSRLRSSYSCLRSDSPFREDWRRTVNYEFLRLKEELSILRERLGGGENRPLPDLRRLAEEMREEGAIRESTWAFLLSSPCGPREMEREEVREALLRVLRLFSELRRMRRERVGAQG